MSKAIVYATDTFIDCLAATLRFSWRALKAFGRLLKALLNLLASAAPMICMVCAAYSHVFEQDTIEAIYWLLFGLVILTARIAEKKPAEIIFNGVVNVTKEARA